jgi:hypothetical protein
VSPPRTASGLPEPTEDALQFFLYRVQVGAAIAHDAWSPAEIQGLLEPPPAGADPLGPRIQTALASALRQDRAQARNAARLAAAIGHAEEPALAAWRRHRAALAAGAPDTRLRQAVVAFALDAGVLRRWWQRLRRRP